MNALRTHFAIRTAAVLVALLAWLALSNHCALAARFPASATAESSCCQGQHRPSDGDAPCPDLPQGCCKALNVAMPGEAKVPPAVAGFDLLAVEMVAALVLAPPAETGAADRHGRPPDVPGFAELVLHRSLRSHAPPVFA